MIGYAGEDPGIAATVAAGSMVIFSSLTLHRSSSNTTDMIRRAYLAQYSPEPIIDPATNQITDIGPLGVNYQQRISQRYSQPTSKPSY